MNSSAKPNKSRIEASLYALLVGDALAVPGHWYYSTTNLRTEYGGDGITHMMEPHPHHAESMLGGDIFPYKGSIDIFHDKVKYFKDNFKVNFERNGAFQLSTKGASNKLPVHYHVSLKKGQNSANAAIFRLLMRYLAKSQAPKHADNYQPNEFLELFYEYLTTPPNDNDNDIMNQVKFHNDVYLDKYICGFFTKASQGTKLSDCAMSQRESWSIGSLDGVVMSIPIIAAYAYEPESYVMGRVVEHHMLTHKSVTVTATLYVLVPLLLELYRGAELREALDRAMVKMRPPKITARQMFESYKASRGPDNIPLKAKWDQHMILDEHETVKDLVHRLLHNENDEDIAGALDRPNSRIATACYCEHSFIVVLYLAYKYGPEDPRKALIQNVNLGGHSTARGAVLGAILGAAFGEQGPSSVPFYGELAAHDTVLNEIAALIKTI